MNETTRPVNDNFLLQLFVNPKYSLYRHLLLIFLFGLVWYNRRPTEDQPLVIRVVSFVVLLSLFYLNMYQMVPKLLFRNRYGQYALSVMGLIVVGLVVMGLVVIGGRHVMPMYVRNLDRFKVFGFIFMFCMLIAASTAVKLFQRWIADSQRINELERITMQSELEQLKNQINPHFLFNMLNNANVLVQRDPEKASQVLMKLSDLLRYQLYDSVRSKVLLTADIHFLTDFLNLEKIRRDHFEFIVSKEGNISGLQIPPLLFITFVENAVKHNMDAEKPSYVHVYFDVNNEELHFKCINSKPQLTAVRSETGGVGLVNVKRTLALLYPNKHTLAIEDKAGSYSVNLTIRL